ncbi:hypothetical protein OHA27_33315 [Streptomyces sp. NBC_01619]|uniref:hypothetical protein n=1 Tax=Streptomyces sp. NBC_01619 TaxID=2975901 RepID=UPI0022556F54|nr:hypothetical protein [Streptomyces sp. NBC_01619]MCX4515118.1 hypothetical protein [Streptomyces sp. NBC_01619]
MHGRKHWATRQPGTFRGAIWVESGEIDGLRPKWSRGYGRWVRDILVRTKGPFLFRNVLIPADALNQQRPARHDEVKRLGDRPTVIRLKTDDAFTKVAAGEGDATLLLGLYHQPSNPDARHPGAPTGT